MLSRESLISKIKPEYFWDVDLSGLDDKSSCRLIIERVFFLGNMHEMNQVVRFYGKNKVADVLCNLSFIDAKSFNFIKKLFNKPDEDFRCHHQKQLKPRLWSL
jgi:hypothetical protein